MQALRKDRSMMNLSQRRAFNKRGGAELHRIIDAAKAEIAATKAIEDAANADRIKAERIKRKAVIEYTEDEYKSARIVRDEMGWHAVVRVNAKSVTIKTPYSWTERIARPKILEVKS